VSAQIADERLESAGEGELSKEVNVLGNNPRYLEAIQLGARDYMLKPLPPSEIGELVAKHLPSRSGSA